MQRTAAPAQELQKAMDAINKMESSQNLDDFEESWKQYLGRIERVFNKATAHYMKSPKWNAWSQKVIKLRSSDELLSYLRNARGADEHTVNEIVSRQSGGFTINPAHGTRLHIDNLTIDGGRIVELRARQPVRIDFAPDRTMLLPVLNRGRTYKVPTSHLGGAISSENVIGVAKLGHKFYEEFLKSAEQYFCA